MKCQHCPKLAALQITEVLADHNYEEYHFCEDCAQKYLYTTSTKKKSVPTSNDSLETNEKSCEHCGTKFVDFRNTGRLGCPHDYQTFQSELLPLLESIHNSTRHAGKTPRRPSRQVSPQELMRLRKDLSAAIKAESYEEAARLRDRIRQIEGE